MVKPETVMNNDTTTHKWEYGGKYKRHDMEGVLSFPPHDSKLQVCDIVKELPDFMLEADTIFIDPPCSEGNLKTFATKADKKFEYSYVDFTNALFQRIDQINPDHLFIEVFASNKDAFTDLVEMRYPNVICYISHYYKKKTNRCWILHGSHDLTDYRLSLGGRDEEKCIEWICNNHRFKTIGDLCMGQGLVGKYASKASRRFVGTEVNKKRLGVLVDYLHRRRIK